jgi:hypothetical protein
MHACSRSDNPLPQFQRIQSKKVEAANMEKFWKLALQANKDNRPAPTTPMEKIIANYPNMETSRMHDKPAILDQLCACKETTDKQSQRRRACMDLNAKSCYYGIMASFSILCSRYFGMPKDACFTM